MLFRSEAMSISDQIVVMAAGVLQQMGPPQDVYDDPDNLFTAKFLGTPAINVFHGTVRAEKLYIGDTAVLDVPGVADQEVWAGIRPEGFVISADGPFVPELIRVEVMGRDTSVVCRHPACENDTIRAIVPSDSVNREEKTVRFALKPAKVHLFAKDTEQRIRTGGK